MSCNCDLCNEIARLNDELAKARADNAMLESAFLRAETIQPNGEIGTSIVDLVRELDRSREGERVAMAQLSNAQRRITELNTELSVKNKTLNDINAIMMKILDCVKDSDFVFNRIFEASNKIYSTMYDDEKWYDGFNKTCQ